MILIFVISPFAALASRASFPSGPGAPPLRGHPRSRVPRAAPRPAARGSVVVSSGVLAGRYGSTATRAGANSVLIQPARRLTRVPRGTVSVGRPRANHPGKRPCEQADPDEDHDDAREGADEPEGRDERRTSHATSETTKTIVIRSSLSLRLGHVPRPSALILPEPMSRKAIDDQAVDGQNDQRKDRLTPIAGTRNGAENTDGRDQISERSDYAIRCTENTPMAVTNIATAIPTADHNHEVAEPSRTTSSATSSSLSIAERPSRRSESSR